MHKKRSREELNSVFAQSWRRVCVRALQMCVCVRFRCVCVRFRCVCVRALQVCVCVCASDVCAENFSHSTRLLLQQFRASFILASCLRAVLISSPDTWDWMRMHALALVVMHRLTLCENVDSAKIKVPFYTTDIDILCMASMHRIVIHRIDESLHPYYFGVV